MLNFFQAKEEYWSAICVAVAFIFLSLLMQGGSDIFARFVGEPVTFVRLSKFEWSTEVGRLAPGNYYFSAGRPRSSCQVWFGDEKVFSNESGNDELVDTLMVGRSFVISHKTPPNLSLKLRCNPLSGFGVRLTHDPVVATERLGKILQVWRSFTELIIGPLFSFVLFFSLLTQIRRGSNRVRTGIEKIDNAMSATTLWPYFAFSVVSIVYSFSLSYYTRLFIPGVAATLLHIGLRTSLSLATVFIFGQYSRIRVGLVCVHVCFVLGDIFTAYINPDRLAGLYNWQYLLFPVSMLVLAWDMFKVEANSRSIILMRGLALAWGAVCILDTIKLVSDFGAYSAPSVLALSAASIAYIQYWDKAKLERIQVATSRILAVIEAKSSIREILAQIASITQGETHFSRASAYIDAYCIGQSDKPSELFVRVMESGYSKDTSKDREIRLFEGRGDFMAKALSSGAIRAHQGEKDQAWFANVPLGKHACLNLSDTRPMPKYVAYEAVEVLTHLLPALNSLNSRLMDVGARQAFALERLRSIRGDGKWETEVGSIFADINDYSLFTERYGSDFSEFVGTVYFPALAKALRRWVVPEFTRGDEIYLVAIKPLIQDDSNVRVATMHAVAELMNFIRGPGRALCAERGFEAFTLSVGVNVGEATVICDPLRVRTAGQSINEAKRLQEAAGKGRVLIKASATELVDANNLMFGEEMPVLIKKNLIMARTLIAA